MSPIDTVLFDLDGTLIDSMPELAFCSNQTRLAMGYEELPFDTLSTFVGKGLERLIIRFLTNDINATTADEIQLAEAKRIFSKFYHQYNGQISELYPQVREGLEALKAEGFKLGVVTNKAIEFTLPLLAHKELSHYFDSVIGGDSCAYKKPHPAPVLLALEELQSTPEQALFVGDSLNDAAAAKAAGLPCLLVPYGYNEGQTLVKPEPGALVNDLMGVVEWLAKENPRRQST